MSIEHDHTVRDELWSDVFDVACGHLDELEELDPAQVRSWLLRTARYVTANAARRSIARRRLVDRLIREPLELASSAEEEFFGAEPSAEEKERASQVSAAWERLAGDQRDVLAMDALGNRGPAIAARLEITHQAARLRLMRARAAFAASYQQVCDGDDHGMGRP
ncbi:MAG: sigma-70 family RNA polymerase sigma factor [Acidimicrobiia bacterium]|nr:sigma-70 family RNA polymerase sigma factor [Acidimicrobiia bacterium]